MPFERWYVSTTSRRSFSPQTAGLQPVLRVLERYREEVQRALRDALPSGEMLLQVPLQYQMGWVDKDGNPTNGSEGHGKAIRPTLCLLACEALDGDWRRALPAAAALELVHNFSLIHDDIQDGDVERRHRPTLWRVLGKPRALAAGNAMLAYALRGLDRLADGGFSSEIRLRVSSILMERCLEMIEGQYLDLSYEGRLDVDTRQYVEMVSRKTGALMQCATEMGAVLAGQTEEVVRLMARCGHAMGVAFQIRDDILGIWGDSAVTGKAAGNDIWRRKKSFPVVYALEHARGASRDRLLQAYSKREITVDDVEQVMLLLEEVGAQLSAQTLAEDMASDALDALDKVPMAPCGREAISALIQFLVVREH